MYIVIIEKLFKNTCKYGLVTWKTKKIYSRINFIVIFNFKNFWILVVRRGDRYDGGF